MEKAILGLDIGGTGIKGGVLINGHLEDIRSIATPAKESKGIVKRSAKCAKNNALLNLTKREEELLADRFMSVRL